MAWFCQVIARLRIFAATVVSSDSGGASRRAAKQSCLCETHLMLKLRYYTDSTYLILNGSYTDWRHFWNYEMLLHFIKEVWVEEEGFKKTELLL